MEVRECKEEEDERERAGARLSGTYTVIPRADFTPNVQPPEL